MIHSTIGNRSTFLPQRFSATSTSPEIESSATAEVHSAEVEASGEQLSGWSLAVQAAQSKKAADIKVLDLTGVTTFTDHFVICTAGNSRQMQAITDEIALQLKRAGEPAVSIEGYDQGEWILSDYSDFIVHVFSEKARGYYDLDRLWREGKALDIPSE